MCHARIAVILSLLSAPYVGEAAAQGPLDFLQSGVGTKYALDPVAPGDLLGVVIDTDEQGVAGATVYLRPAGNWGNRYDDSSLQQTVTDNRGQYVFRGLKEGEYVIAAVKDDRSSRTELRKWRNVSHSLKLDAEPVVLPLKPARQARLQIVDGKTGQPLANAKVRVRYWDMRQFWQADGEGRVSVEGLLPRSYEISATATGYAKREVGANLKSASESDLTLRMQPGATLSGVIRDASGEPIVDSNVHLRRPNSGDFFDYMRTDSQGAYRFEHAPVGVAIKIDFAGKGYHDHNVVIDPLKPGEARVHDGHLRKLPYGGAVSGVVLDEAGEPVIGAEVLQWGRSSSDKRITYTDQQGRFLIDNLYPKGDKLEVIVKASGFASAVEAFKPGTREQPAELSVMLKPGERIHGRVVDESGKPIGGARVSFGKLFFGPGERVITGPDGRFSFDTLPPGIDLTVTARGYSERDRLKLPTGTDETIDVILQPQGFVRGRVVDASTGKPVESFNVRLGFSPDRKPGDPSHGISTKLIRPGQRHSSPEGLFEINDQAVGHPFMVAVEAAGYRTRVLRRVEAVRPDDPNRAVFELTPLSPERLRTIAGVVVDAQGEPRPGVQVRLLASVDGQNASRRPIEWYLIRGHNAGDTDDQLQQSMLCSTDEQGRFRFEGVYDDLKVELAYWGAGVAPTRKPGVEQLPDEEQQKLHIVSAAAATVSVHLDPKAFAGASIVQLNPKTNSRGYDPSLSIQQQDNEGRWTIANVSPGRYELTVARYELKDPVRGGYGSVTMHKEDLQLAPGEKRVLELKVPKLPSQSQKALKSISDALKTLTFGPTE